MDLLHTKKSITDSHEEAIQVTDRFHFLKNLTEGKNTEIELKQITI